MSKSHNIKKTPPLTAKIVKQIPVYIYSGICALIAFLLYISTVTYDYTVDDATVIANNKLTTGGISAIPEILSSPYRAGFWSRKEGLYRPLSVVMFAIEWEVAPKQPWLGHLINILIYTGTCAFLFLLLFELLGKEKAITAFFMTMLFTVLPVHTEVVSNIKSRDELLCFLFGLISIYYICRWVRQKKIYYAVVSGLCFFLALLSKENAITLIPVFPLVLWFFTEQDVNR
jgi:protein O-mannosyl-transferase